MTNTVVPRFVAVPGVVLLAALAASVFPAQPAMAQRRAVAAPAGQTVNLPYVLRDTQGSTWDIQMDGSIGDGGDDLYDGGGRMDLGGAVYQAQQQQVQFNPAVNEVTMPPMNINGLSVTRKIHVNANLNYCRWTEILENPTAQPIRSTMHLHWDLGSTNMQSRPIEDEKTHNQMGVAIFDGRRGIAMMCAGRGSKVPVRFQMQQGSDQIEQFYEVEVPAKKSIALVHVQAWRPTQDQAAGLIIAMKDKDLLEDIPKEIRRTIVNFKHNEGLVLGDIELPRSELLDTIELRTGDQYRGTLRDVSFKLDTFHGPIELPADRLVGMLTAGTYRPLQLFVTTDGEIVGGTLATPTLRFQLSSGQPMNIPLNAITKIGCRKRPGEPEEWRFDKPMAFLRDGQRLTVEAPATAMTAATIYGPVELKPEWIGSIAFLGEEQAVHQIRLKDGSKFNALMTGQAVEMKLAGTSAGLSAQPAIVNSPGLLPAAVKFELSNLARLQFVVDPQEEAEEVPAMALINGDVLVGVANDVLELDTGFDLIKLKASEIRGMRHVEPGEGQKALPAEMTVTMWDGAMVSGRLKGDAVAFALKSGSPIKVPVSLISRYAHPSPTPPPEMIERMKAVIVDLSNPDWKTRERSAAMLRSMGQGAMGVLKQCRDAQPPEAQKIIDNLLKSLEKEKASAAKSGTSAAGGTGGAQPQMAIEGQVEVEQRQFPLLNARH